MVAQDVDINSFYWGLYHKFKVEIGLKNPLKNEYDDNIIWFKQGIFIITNFTTSQSLNTFNISISGKDKMCMLNGDIGGAIPYQTDFGTEEIIEYEYEEVKFENGIKYKPNYYYTYNNNTLQYDLSEQAIPDTENLTYYKKTGAYSTIYKKIPVKDILINLLHSFAGEPYHNIVIQDLDTRGLELLEYRGDESLYLTYNVHEGIYSNIYVGNFNCFVKENGSVRIYPVEKLPADYYNKRIDLLDRGEEGVEVYLNCKRTGVPPEKALENDKDLYIKDLKGEFQYVYELIEEEINQENFKNWIGIAYYVNLKTGKLECISNDSVYDSNVKEYYKKDWFILDESEDTFTISKLEYGQAAGYRITDLIYPGDLIANIGEPITSVLDKIKNTFGDFEYFYDIDGRFIWRLKKTYVNTVMNGIVQTDGDEYVDSAAFVSDTVYHFENGTLITSYQNTPNLQNLRNDYSIWGTRKSVNGADLPIHLRYAIDNKPEWYRSLTNHIYITNDSLKYKAEDELQWVCNEIIYQREIINKEEISEAEKIVFKEEYLKSHLHLVDWREIIYQMAKDYMRNGPDEDFPEFEKDNFLYYVSSKNQDYYPTGITGYEQYYTDILGFWRQLYNPFVEDDGCEMVYLTSELKKYDKEIGDEDSSVSPIDFRLMFDDEGEEIDRGSIQINVSTEPIEINSINDWINRNDIYFEKDGEIWEIKKYNKDFENADYYMYSDDSVVNINFYNDMVEALEKSVNKDGKDYCHIDSKWYEEIKKLEYYFLAPCELVTSGDITGYNCNFGTLYYVKIEKFQDEENINTTISKYTEVERIEEVRADANVENLNFYTKIDEGEYKKVKIYSELLAPTSQNDGSKTRYYCLLDRSENYYTRKEIIDNDGDFVEYKYDLFTKPYFINIADSNQKAGGGGRQTTVSLLTPCFDEIEVSSTENGEEKTKICYELLKEKLEEILEDLKINNKIIFIKEKQFQDYSQAYILDENLYKNATKKFLEDNNGIEFFTILQNQDWYNINDFKYKDIILEKDYYKDMILLNGTKYSLIDPYQKIDIFYKYPTYNYYRYGEKQYWNKSIIKNPISLNFWFDFLDSEEEYFDKEGASFTQGSELNAYKVPLIGDRSKVINDKDVTSIYFREVPNLIYDEGYGGNAEELNEFSGYVRVYGVPYDYFTISAQGKSAKDKLDELIYQHSYCIETINISALPVYYLEPNTRILITDKNSKIDGEYIVNRISYSLTHNGTMNIGATKAPTRLY